MTRQNQDNDLLLVGSVPLETAAEVLETCGRTLGDHLNYLPDGEVGDRILWVTMLAYRVFHGHPDIDTLARPPRIDGIEAWKKKYAPKKFGLAAPCGLGRHGPDEVKGLLNEHIEAARSL